MDPFRLAEGAVADIDAIWLYLLNKYGLESADSTVTELFKSFSRLAEIPHLGHRRPDLTERTVLFYRVFSYLIIYASAMEGLQILGVVHSKRDIRRVLASR